MKRFFSFALMCLFVVTVLSANVFAVDESQFNIYYPNGDWEYVPSTISIPSNQVNPYSYALQTLINGEKLPAGCYNEIPRGSKVNSFKIVNNVAYLDLDKNILTKIDNKN